MRTPFDFPEQEEPFYCFKMIDTKEGPQLVRFEITKYDRYSRGPYEKGFSFAGNAIGARSRVEVVKESKFDRVVSNKLFTFNPAVSNAEAIFESHFKGALIAAATKYTAAEQAYVRWRDRNNA